MNSIYSIRLLIITTILVCSCKSDEKKSTSTKFLEKFIESQTGESYELTDDYALENSSAKVDYTIDGKPFFESKEFTSGVVVKAVNGFLELYLQLHSEDGKTMMIASQKIPQDFKLPLTIPFVHLDNPSEDDMVATMSATDLSDPQFGLGFSLPYEGELTITKMQNRLVAFEVNAKGGDYMMAQSPENWKPIKAKIELINPIIQSMGIEKSKIFK